MKKCTLCIDRIYNDNLAPEDQQPACVMVCPVSARHFGDLGDPDSEVSQMVADRGGGDLLPELGYRPVNKYLPPRPQRMMPRESAADRTEPVDQTPPSERLLRWVDRLLSR
jgi:Fe-S-cluster-containing dehydrogenase component